MFFSGVCHVLTHRVFSSCLRSLLQVARDSARPFEGNAGTHQRVVPNAGEMHRKFRHTGGAEVSLVCFAGALWHVWRARLSLAVPCTSRDRRAKTIVTETKRRSPVLGRYALSFRKTSCVRARRCKSFFLLFASLCLLYICGSLRCPLVLVAQRWPTGNTRTRASRVSQERRLKVGRES